MTLEMNEAAMREKLRIIRDQSGDMPWLPSDINIDYPKQKRVEPFPGACIKTWTEKGEKVFINICHSRELCPPEDISDERFVEILQEDIPGFVIPMAVGIEKMSKDKDDIERATFDALLNTDYFEKCMKKQHFLRFTIAAILEYINDKYKKNIDIKKYVILKNRKVMGSLDTFNIEDRLPRKPAIKKPLIQVLDSKEENKSKNPAIKNKKDSHKLEKNSKLKNYIIVMSSNQESMIGYFYLPQSNLSDLTIDIGENRIMVENQKADSLIDLYVPHSIDNALVSAHYDSILNILRLTLPLKKH